MKNVSRKISMLLLCAMMLTIVFSYGASAEVVKNEWRDIKWDYDTLIDAVTIHCSGVVPVSKDMPWKDKANDITAFVFDSGVTEIPAGFSDGCVSMDAIKIPATTRSIGEGVLTVGNLTDIWYEGTWESFLQIKMSEKDLAAAKKARFHGSMLLRNEDGSVEYVEIREDTGRDESPSVHTEYFRGEDYILKIEYEPEDGIAKRMTYIYDNGRVEIYEYNEANELIHHYSTREQNISGGMTSSGSDIVHTQTTRETDDGTQYIEEYDENKNLVKRTVKYTDGRVIVYEFHSNANWSYKATETRTDGTVTVSDFNEDTGKIIQITTTYPNGTKTVAEFADDGETATKLTVYAGDGTKIVAEYADDGKTVTKLTVYADDGETVTRVNEYRDDGTTEKVTEYHTDGTKTVAEYADDGEKVTKLTEYAADGTVTRVIEYRDNSTTEKVTENHTDGTKSVMEYADNGFTVLKRTDFRDNGTMEKVTECNGIGREILVTEYANDGTTITKTTETAYAADDMTPTQTTEKRGNGTVEKVTVYDGQGEEIFSVDYPESEGITEVSISDVDTEHGTIKEITTKTDEGETVHYYNEEGEETTPAGSPIVE